MSKVNSEDCLSMIDDECAKLGDVENDFCEIDFEKSSSDFPDTEYLHASHGMLFARTDRVLWNTYNAKGMVLVRTIFFPSIFHLSFCVYLN